MSGWLRRSTILACAVACLVFAGQALSACSNDGPPTFDPQSIAQSQTTAEQSTPQPERADFDDGDQQSQPTQATPSEADAEQQQASAAEPPPADDEESVESADEGAADEEAEPAAPEPWPADAPLEFDSAVVRGSLSNGLVYYIRENREPRTRAQLSLVLRAGSVLETERERGLAHFVEHMAFNGTERFAKQEIIEYLESIGSSFGADLNAATSFDYTYYWLEIPTDDPEILETSFQILSDWAYAVSFSPEEVDLERGVVLEEWRLYQGFNSRFQTNLFPLLFGDSIYADREPIGLTTILEGASAEDLRGFYERWYRPDLMAIVAVGDFDATEIEAQIVQHFAPPPEGEAAQPAAVLASETERPQFQIPDNAEPIVDVFTDVEAPTTQLVLVRKLSPERGADLARFRRQAVEQLAFMMFNSRLTERGNSPDPPWLWAGAGRSSFVDPFDIQTFSIGAEQEEVERGFIALLEEMQRAAQHGFTESELERERANRLSFIEGRYNQRDQQDSSRLAQSYRDHFLGGPPVPSVEDEWEWYQQLLPQIGLAEVDALADEWIEVGNTVVLVIGPEGIEIGEPGALVAALRDQLDRADAMVVDPYGDDFSDAPLLDAVPTPGSIVEEAEIASIDAVRWTLSNGVTVIAKQTDFKNDEVLVTSFSAGGSSLVEDEDYVSASYASELVAGSGIGAHDNVALDKLLAGKRVSLSPYLNDLFEGFSGNASPQDLETLFQLIRLYATEPRFDPDEFSSLEAQLRSDAELRLTQPDWVLYDRVNILLSQGDLRGRPLSVAVVDELDFARAEAVYRDRFADLSDSTFVFVGAFDWDNLRSLTETYLASLPGEGRAEGWRDVDPGFPVGVFDEVVRSGIDPRSSTVWVYVGELDQFRDDAFALSAASEVLQIRLRERIREQLGGTYNVSVFTQTYRLPDSEFLLAIIFGSDPDRATELAAEISVEIDWLRAGAEQEYLDTVKELWRTDREEQLRQNGFWLDQISTMLRYGDPLELIVDFDERLEALTLEGVAAAARRYIDDGRFVRVVLLPESE